MRRRQLGSEGLSVSCIGLGCMGMSHGYGTPEERDESQSIAVIHRAIDLGIDFFDTAEVYGPYTNERLLGKALKGRREGIVVATKFGFEVTGANPLEPNSHPSRIKAVCDASLERLGVDVIDLFYQHRVDPKIPIEEVVGTVGELIDAGKVRFIGLSEAGPETIRRAHNERKISALQSEYSLWERGLEERIIPLLQELGIGLVPFCPMGRGFLTGQIKSFDDIPEGDFRRRDPRYQGENFERNMELVKVVERIARTLGATCAQVAIAWTLQKGESIVPIPGTKRMKYLEENAAAHELEFSKSDLEALDELAEKTSGPRYAPELMARVER